MSQNCSKGTKLTVQGSLKWRQWEDKETGKKRSALSVTARQVEWPKGNAPQQDAPSPDTDSDIPF
jgi:single-strand DNA-binding protein